MILITGSAGFIGFHLALFYLKKNKKVIGIDNLNNYYDVKYKHDRLKILKKLLLIFLVILIYYQIKNLVL